MNRKSVLLGILIIVITCLTTGCLFYNYLEPEDFKNQLSARGYTVNQVDDDIYNSKYSSKASKSDVTHEFVYYQFNSESDSKKAYKELKEELPNLITSTSSDVEKKSSVLSKYICSTDNEYIIISRVKDSLIFVNSTQDQKDSIDEILEDIGY